MEFFLRADVVVFTGVLVVIALVAIVEIIATALAGVGLSHLMEALIDTHSLPDTTMTNWLLIKDVPLMIAVMTACSGFALTGLALQGGSMQVGGSTLPQLVIYPFAVMGAMGAMRTLNGVFKRMKVVHTTALLPADFIGRKVVLLSEFARHGEPGQAKFTDEHGQTHYVMVRPSAEIGELKQGDTLVLQEQTGAFYNVVRA